MEITRRTFLKISGATAVGTWIGGLGFCGNKDQGSLHCFHGEGDEAHRIDLCDKCHQYIKTIDFRKIEESDPVLEDLATLHLDVLATQKGNKRPVPNPWAIKVITALRRTQRASSPCFQKMDGV